ncbi:MAG: hypothetical protein IJT95_00495 [Abditibacteriota bacterium]|nr:hypothetical protein [Abditibacteriota bacterium]
MRITSLWRGLIASAAVLLLALAVYVLFAHKEAQAALAQKVYVDAESLLLDYSPDFLQEAFNEVPETPAVADTVADVPLELELRLESLVYVHDTSEFEKAVYARLLEEKDRQFERIMSVMEASAELARRRNIAVGLVQLNPVFEEYDRAGMDKLHRLFRINALESLNSRAGFYSASLKRRLFDTPDNNTRFGEAASQARLDGQRNTQLFMHYMSVSDQFKEQEIRKTVDALTEALDAQVEESRNAKVKKYDSYLEAASELFRHRMLLDRDTAVEYYSLPPIRSFDLPVSDSSAAPLRQELTGDRRKRRDIYLILAGMAEEMGVEIVYTPRKNVPDYTPVFRKKLKDSWQYAPGLISDMEG